jgi:type IX secretion system PorP/SprF family membrane protein
MSNPSFENIDRWFFEYFEGNLSPQQVEQFLQFLRVHPELELEMETWKSAYVKDDAPVYADVASLERPVTWIPYLVSSLAVLTVIVALVVWSPFGRQSLYATNYVDLLPTMDWDEFSLDEHRSQQIPQAASNVVSTESMPDDSEIRDAEEHKVLSLAQLPAATERRHVPYTSQEQLSTFKANQPTAITSLDLSSAGYLNNSTVGRGLMAHAPMFPQVRESIENRDDFVNDYTVVFAGDVAGGQTLKKSNTLSRKAKMVLRKVQRMLDQPIALRNTKDPYLLVPNMTGYMANFGMTGTMIQSRFQATSRNQWVGRGQQQLMNTLAWDGYVHAVRGGLGVDFTYNDYAAGSLSNMQMGLVYSPKFSINKNVSFEPAVRFKMGSMDLDAQSAVVGSFAELNRGNLIPVFVGDNQPTGSRLWYRDAGVGALINTKWFYAGVNLDNIGRHYNNFYSSDISGDFRAATHFSAIAGTEYKALNRELVLSTYIYYQKLNELNELWLGANVRWKMVLMGAAVSTNFDYAGSLGLQFDRFSMHYNVDMLRSSLADKQMVSHQVSVRMLLKPNRYAMQILKL